MEVMIKRVDDRFPLPDYQTTGATAFDMYSRVDRIVAPQEVALLPSNLIIAVPEGYTLLVFPRSSTARKKGLLKPNSVGVIDQDYRGTNDEIMLQVYNFTNTPVEIKAGERLSQGMIVPIVRATWRETADFHTTTDRGGFGSTGGYHENSATN